MPAMGFLSFRSSIQRRGLREDIVFFLTSFAAGFVIFYGFIV